MIRLTESELRQLKGKGIEIKRTRHGYYIIGRRWIIIGGYMKMS